MKIELSAKPFKETQKGAVKKLRREGKIPAVLYGHKEKTRRIYVEKKDFKQILEVLRQETVIVNLKLENKSYNCVIKALQHNPTNEQLLHIDFQHIHKKEKIRATVPIHIGGEAPGVEKGGILDVHLHEIVVRCLPDEIPAHIDVDVAGLDLGDTIHLKDLKTKNIDFELTMETPIVSILVPRALEVAKPEIAEEAIVEKKEEEEAKEEEAIESEKKETKEKEAKETIRRK